MFIKMKDINLKVKKNDFNLKVKKIRAFIIKSHLDKLGLDTCVCFTSGNATRFLRRAGLKVVSIGNKEDLSSNKWFSYTDIQKSFNGLFDATSGHLPLPFLNEISSRLKKEYAGFFNKDKIYPIKIGSGETILCLKLAFPEISFEPIRIKGYAPTKFDKEAPLNDLIQVIFGSLGKMKNG